MGSAPEVEYGVVSKSVVSIVKCRDYAEDRVRRAVREALRLAGIDRELSGDKRILLKPNLLSRRRPEEAVTTHPRVVRSIGEIALAGGCDAALGDSPPFAGENPQKYERLCEATGMNEVARELDVPLVRFEQDVITLPHPTGRFYHSFEIARAVLEADLVINIPKLKTHGVTTFTGGVKNVFGCVPGIRKGLFHVQAAEDRDVFAQMLVDLFGTVRPAVNVMDAVVAMEGEGPNGGTPKQMGVILASSDAVAMDAVACAIAGIDPQSVATTRLAHEQGLGRGDLSDIQIRGETIDAVISGDFRWSSGTNEWTRIPSPIRRVLRRQLVAAPRMRARECVGCGDCATACPVDAITPGKPPAVDLTRCIRCYCCQEVCNHSAVDLVQGWLGRTALRMRKKR